MSSMGFSQSGAFVRVCLVVFAVASALYVSWPALRWRFSGNLAVTTCGPCVCHCPPPLSLETIAPGLINLSIPDCGRSDPELHDEMRKDFVELLREELHLREVVVAESNKHTNLTLVEAQRLASQYQKEAEKCNAATETCEEARERAEAFLRKERKITSVWEERARQLDWQGEQ